MIALPPSEEGVLQLIVLQDPGSGAPREDTPVGGAGTVATSVGVGMGVGDGGAGAATGGGDTAMVGAGETHSTTHRWSPVPSSGTARESARSEQVGEAPSNRDVHSSRDVCSEVRGGLSKTFGKVWHAWSRLGGENSRGRRHAQ